MAEWTLLLCAKLRHGDPVHPVVLVVVDAESQILFQLLVHPLCLPIHLWVVGCGGVVLDAQEPVEADRELRLELWAPVMDDLLGDSMQPKDVVPQQPGCVPSIE